MNITVETHIKAPVSNVWSAYTSPSDITQWNAASDDWHTTTATVDLRVGGAFSSRMEAKDGSFGFDFAGTYTKIVPNELIAYAFGDRVCTVAFMAGANGVTVRVTFDAETENPVEQQREGWQAILNNFARHVEAHRDIMSVILEGGCLCGKVRFRANQPPVRTFACHCKFCQRVTGTSFFAESIFPLDAVQFNDSELSRYAHVSDGSQKKVFVHFCPNCGTTVGLTFERWPEVRAIARGCYDDPNAVDITSHIWTASAQTGVVLPAGIECFAGARARLDGQPEQATIHDRPVMARPG